MSNARASAASAATSNVALYPPGRRFQRLTDRVRLDAAEERLVDMALVRLGIAPETGDADARDSA